MNLNGRGAFALVPIGLIACLGSARAEYSNEIVVVTVQVATTPTTTTTTTEDSMTADNVTLPPLGASDPVALMMSATDPYFDASTQKNLTALVGKTAYMTCTVHNLGNKTVSTQISFQTSNCTYQVQ